MRAKVQMVPRTVVETGLGVARVPLAVAARVTGQHDNDRWAPTLAFEGLEGGIETVLGSWLRDEDLVARGRLRQAKVAEIRHALRLETLAEREREEAAADLGRERDRAQRKTAEARRRTAKREQELVQDAAAKQQEADRVAAAQEAATAQVAAAQEAGLERQEQAARAEALDREAEALQARQEALDAQEKVAAIEDTLEGTKAAREAG